MDNFIKELKEELNKQLYKVMVEFFIKDKDDALDAMVYSLGIKRNDSIPPSQIAFDEPNFYPLEEDAPNNVQHVYDLDYNFDAPKAIECKCPNLINGHHYGCYYFKG